MARPSVRSGVPTMVRNPGAARHRKAGPLRLLVVEMVEIRDIDLPIFTNHRTRQVAAVNLRTFCRVVKEFGADLLRALTNADRQFEFVALGYAERNADGAEQPRCGLGDLAQRTVGVAGRGGNGPQNVGRGGLLLQRLAQLACEQRNLLVCIGGGKLATARDLWRTAALGLCQRATSLFHCLAVVFADAESGQTAAVPPRSVMNSRRRMGPPRTMLCAVAKA